MKLILSLIFIVILIPNIAFSRFPITYSVDITKGSCNISLYVDGKYEMWIDEWYGDQGAGFTISSGEYQIKDNGLLLIDSYNLFEMKFIFKNGYLISEKSFIFAKDFKFEFFVSSTDSVSTFSDVPNAIEIARKKFTNKKAVKLNFEFGKYVGEYDYRIFSFNIKSNHSFEIKVEDLTLLSGTWKRVGNELRLYDTTLKHTFFVFIAENKLINYIFNEQIGIQYFKVKTNQN